MKIDLKPFQEVASNKILSNIAKAVSEYQADGTQQIISFTAPTGAGKTIIMTKVIESVFTGSEGAFEKDDAIFLWLSDLPELNEQSRDKILFTSELEALQLVMIDEGFDSEYFTDGQVYFLNTQKLGKDKKLVRHGDDRTFTIWETLRNTINEKSDRFCIIIDEAHRGMKSSPSNFNEATTIMQKFIKGSTEHLQDGDVTLPFAPLVIGMSATIERFNNLVQSVNDVTKREVKVEAKDVQDSGLLKERILITYPTDSVKNREMALLEAAARDWCDKCSRWDNYCERNHREKVRPILIVQVKNGKADLNKAQKAGSKEVDIKALSDTDIADCFFRIQKIAGYDFQKWEVVHTFGSTGDIEVGSFTIPRVEANDIAGNENIRVVFFKENLSTGWDCPRAETLMSFRTAEDSTYIAQLLGRMVRNPLQMKIKFDDTLNEVNLFLPHFNAEAVSRVIQSYESEGGEIPCVVTTSKTYETLSVNNNLGYNNSLSNDAIEVKTIHTQKNNTSDFSLETQSDATLFSGGGNTQDATKSNTLESVQPFDSTITQDSIQQDTTLQDTNLLGVQNNIPNITGIPQGKGYESSNFTTNARQSTQGTQSEEGSKNVYKDTSCNSGNANWVQINSKEIIDFINKSSLITYEVRSVRINKYLKSLCGMKAFLLNNSFDSSVKKEVNSAIVQKIRSYIDDLKTKGVYKEQLERAKKFNVFTKVFDSFGKSLTEKDEGSLWTTNSDIIKQFNLAEKMLYNDGVAYNYVYNYTSDSESEEDCMVDVILFVANEENMQNLEEYAKETFHTLDDNYRRKVAQRQNEELKKEYDNIVCNSDSVTKHTFSLPEAIKSVRYDEGKEYHDHLFVNKNGVAKIKLNTWEEDVIAEEEKRADFVACFRNTVGASWSFCLARKDCNEAKAFYPDFLVIRKDGGDYIIDILEPHRDNEKDNLSKAKALCQCVRDNVQLGRVQLIRKYKDATKGDFFKRLDLANSAIREKVEKAMTNEELDHIFMEL